MTRRRRSGALGAGESSCYTVYQPSEGEVRRALTDRKKEAVYFVDADLLIYGDEDCVRDSRLYSADERWTVHNHPEGGDVYPSVGDFCGYRQLGARRGDIIGWMPGRGRAESRAVVFSVTNARRGGPWPCFDANPHEPVPAEVVANFDFQVTRIANYALFRDLKGYPNRWYKRMGLRTEAVEEAAMSMKSRFSKLEIDGPVMTPNRVRFARRRRPAPHRLRSRRR